VIEIPRALLEAIRDHAGERYPEECCGVLIGNASEGRKVVRAVERLRNSWRDDPGRRYLIGPLMIRAVERKAESEGLSLLGIYHSHPDHPAQPSETDRKYAWPWYSYVIVRVDRGTPDGLSSWVLSEDRARFEEEELRCP
jgi:proteasome lid subunit RPN8/RPN11